jgi:nucleoside-diphosphate-sugar epimerase
MNRLVLLTGATGFVGRQVLRALGEHGVAVRPVIRSGTERRLETGAPVESVVTTPDLFSEDSDWWSKVCSGVDTVIHVAWIANVQSPKHLDCLAGTLQLAKGAARASIRRFVGIGTCLEYDVSHGVLSINSPLLPLTPYGAAKAAAFMALSRWLPSQGVDFAWCRLFYLYGEGEDSQRLVSYLRAKLMAGERADLTTGNQVRDYLDVRDAGRMIIEIALGAEQGAINVCSGQPVTVRQLAEAIADEYGRRDLLRFGMRPDNPVDPPRIVGVR